MPAPHVLRLAGAAVALSAAPGCVQATPFGTAPDEHDLNARNVEALFALESNAAPRFAALGDSHAALDELGDLADAIGRRTDIQFVAHAGDLTDTGLLWEFEWAQSALARSGKPTFVALGNHDVLSSGREIFRKLYGPFDFSFVWAGVKWLFFNSNRLDFDDSVPNRDWLTAELESRTPGQRTVLVTHRPLANSEDPGGSLDAFYAGLFSHHPVTLVIHGHMEEFRYYRAYGTRMLQCSSFDETLAYVTVTLGSDVLVKLCRGGRCTPALLEEEGSE